MDDIVEPSDAEWASLPETTQNYCYALNDTIDSLQQRIRELEQRTTDQATTIQELMIKHQRLREVLIFAFDYMTGNMAVDADGLDKWGDTVAALLREGE